MVMINGRSSSWRVSTLRNNSPQKPKKRYHIGLAGSLLVLIGVVFCMDSWMRPGIIRLATNIEPRITIFPNNSCRYHGNCREGTVCDPTGFCQPYYQNETSTTPQHINCVQTCLQELTNEELFQYGSIPVVQFTSVAAPPHTGCVIHFQRQRRTPKWTGDPPSQAFRIAQRWRSVIRIDYAGQENHWMVMCRQPCTTSEDCPKGLTCQGRRSDNTKELQWVRTCQPPQPYVSDMILVSGCNDYYFHGLQNFAASLHYWAPHRKLVLYNLGMTTDQLTEAQEWPNVLAIRWPKGIPSSYPSHVQDDLSNYAWKSLVINETVHEFKSIFWMDAGATFVGPIEPIEEIVQLHGIFLVKGQDDHMKYRSHPATYQWHGYDKSTFVSGPSFAGGIQGHVYPSRYIDTIVIPNAKCALDIDCIAPLSADLGHHRYDQTSLSILAYQPHLRVPCYTEFLAGSRAQLQSNLSLPSRPYIFWTARQACDYYKLEHGFGNARF